MSHSPPKTIPRLHSPIKKTISIYPFFSHSHLKIYDETLRRRVLASIPENNMLESPIPGNANVVGVALPFNKMIAHLHNHFEILDNRAIYEYGRPHKLAYRELEVKIRPNSIEKIRMRVSHIHTRTRTLNNHKYIDRDNELHFEALKDSFLREFLSNPPYKFSQPLPLLIRWVIEEEAPELGARWINAPISAHSDPEWKWERAPGIRMVRVVISCNKSYAIPVNKYSYRRALRTPPIKNPRL
jgi:hypothetical protein